MSKNFFLVSRLALGFVLSVPSLVFASEASGTIRVVSDIDDTTKITNVGDPLSTLWNSMFSSRAFVGMKELYSSFSFERAYAFHYVTGAPSFYQPKVEDFLTTNGFPKGQVHTRPVFRDLYAFKLETLKELFKNNPDDRFILIGDDTQKDAEVYDEIFQSAPGRILVIYIRKVTNRPLPPSTYPFLTAFDIARTEHLMGRMNLWEASPVALAILSEMNDRRIVPKFAYCPAKRSIPFQDQRVEGWNEQIGIRVQKICKDRKLPDEVL